MGQYSTGIRSILSSPVVYTIFQNVMGARKGWINIVENYLKVQPNQNLLDIGCGPADVLSYLPTNLNYWGFDVSDNYIDTARKRYGSRGKFYSKILNADDLSSMPKFDIVLMSGVLHHLDDSVALNVITIACKALKEGGRLVTIDPCFADDQSLIARYLISKDRGQNVRNAQGYLGLVQDVFNSVNQEVVHKTWIPYTHCYMVCTK